MARNIIDNAKTYRTMKLPVQSALLLSLLIVLLNAYQERMGTYPSYSGGRFSSSELMGIIFPILIMLMPIFAPQHKEQCWKKSNIALAISVLVISIVILMVMYANKDFYRNLWIEQSHWTRDACPPIRWDIWNIIGKKA